MSKATRITPSAHTVLVALSKSGKDGKVVVFYNHRGDAYHAFVTHTTTMRVPRNSRVLANLARTPYLRRADPDAAAAEARQQTAPVYVLSDAGREYVAQNPNPPGIKVPEGERVTRHGVVDVNGKPKLVSGEFVQHGERWYEANGQPHPLLDNRARQTRSVAPGHATAEEAAARALVDAERRVSERRQSLTIAEGRLFALRQALDLAGVRQLHYLPEGEPS